MTSEPIRREASSPTAEVNQVIKKGALATICNSVAMVNIEAANNSEKVAELVNEKISKRVPM